MRNPVTLNPSLAIPLQETREGYVLEAPPDGVDRRTAVRNPVTLNPRMH